MMAAFHFVLSAVGDWRGGRGGGRTVMLEFTNTSDYRLAIFLLMMFEFTRELVPRLNTQLGILHFNLTTLLCILGTVHSEVNPVTGV